jgi:23S rRNA (uracil1939-C5)-methyltransferase
MTAEVTDPLVVETTAMAEGGAAVARDGDGRVVFVEGALAGERVSVEITDTEKKFARGRVIEVLDAAPGRIAPVCPEVAHGCGGCGWAHVSRSAQLEAKAAMVAESLVRLARIEPPAMSFGPDLAETGFRTTVRAAVSNGRAGFRRARSNEVVPIESCRVAHPRIEQLLVEGRYGDAKEVTLRVGASSGEAIAMVSPSADDVIVPDGVRVISTDELDGGRRAWIHDEVAGVNFRISARAFFQGRADGAAALVEVVRAAVGENPGRLVDLCCGVGLFATTIEAERVVGIESDLSAVADARVNMAPLGDKARVVSSRFQKWRPSRADVVIADPARHGLGKAGVDKAMATGAGRVVLVSCRASAAGRDIGLFTAAGFRVAEMTLVDLFPDTPHVEVVTTLIKE